MNAVKVLNVKISFAFQKQSILIRMLTTSLIIIHFIINEIVILFFSHSE